MNLARLNELNKPLVIENVLSQNFKPYGKVLCHYDFSEMIAYAAQHIQIPQEGNQYIPSLQTLEAFSGASFLQNEVYGQLPIQVGYCAGRNAHLTGLEYHQGSEVVIAVTDCIHLVGKLQGIRDNSYDAGQIRAFFQPRHSATELYSTTLHYAPCKTSEEGYLTLVVLPAGTNSPLDTSVHNKHNPLLTKKNKFLMVHPTQPRRLQTASFLGLRGHYWRSKQARDILGLVELLGLASNTHPLHLIDGGFFDSFEQQVEQLGDDDRKTFTSRQSALSIRHDHWQ